MPSHERLFDIYQFPEQFNEFIGDWDVVYLPDQTKTMLLNYVFTLTRLQHANATGLALRRAVLLYGPPGCGKTSLARGLPAKWASTAREPKVGFIHVNTHALFSGVRGEGQKNVLETFQKISEQATSGFPIFVLIDEVETLGTDRTSISLEANPLDALYQVTAFFESFDKLTRSLPNVVFIFTTNMPKAIDRAVRERVDFSVEIPIPDELRRSQILADAIQSLTGAYDVAGLTHLARSNPPDPDWVDLVRESNGLSGRALRHVLVLAATYAVYSKTLELEHLRSAIKNVRQVEEGLLAEGGMYTEGYQGSGRAVAVSPAAIETTRAQGGAEGYGGAFYPGVAADDASRLGAEIAGLRDDVSQLREILEYRLAGQDAVVAADIPAPNHSRNKKKKNIFGR